MIFVFENEKALGQVLSAGWAVDAQTDAAAKTASSGAAYSGAVQVAQGIWVYQIIKKGLALHLTQQGTKYYKDDDLNKKQLRVTKLETMTLVTKGVRSAIKGIICSRRTIHNYLEKKWRINMVPRPKFSIILCAIFYMSLLFAATVAVQAQKTTAETVKGNATVSTSQLEGEVVQIEGNDLVVKLSTGNVKTFRVPDKRKFLIDGKELSVHDLQPGTTLTATVKTTTTPVTVRTKSVLGGRVWYVAPPTVILTLPDGQNKQYTVKDEDNVGFTIEGRPGTVFDLRKGMTVSAEKIVEEPTVEVTTATTIVGHAPTAASQAAAPGPATASETAAPSAPQSAAPETTAPVAAQPAAPEAGGTQTNLLLWMGLLVVLIIVIVIVVRKSGGKQ